MLLKYVLVTSIGVLIDVYKATLDFLFWQVDRLLILQQRGLPQPQALLLLQNYPEMELSERRFAKRAKILKRFHKHISMTI